MPMAREEAVSGQFYPSDASELRKDVIGYIGNNKRSSAKPYGIIVPHAGYSFSGRTAGYAFNALSGKKADTFIIIGTNHSSSETSLSLEDFKTPLGVAKNDRRFSEELVKLGIEVNERDHAFEHSIEVEIPFLQALFKDVRIVPIAASFSDFDECKRFSEKIVKTIEKLGRKACIIASGDFTHFGTYYGYNPFKATRSKIYAIDKKAIDLISDLKAKEFFEYAKSTTICGASSISAGVETCRRLGARKATLVNYANSGDLTKDYENCVSYASWVIE